MSTTASTALVPAGAALCRAEIARGSKSFALAARLLPGAMRDHATALYTWCRRADDAVDGVAPSERPGALARLRADLERVYRRAVRAEEDLALAAFQEVVHARAIPRAYPEALLDGMAMDVTPAGGAVAYVTVGELLVYCHRVAGVVGLMMSHVMGVRDAAALRHAAHLGIAMQLTNVCRDVDEDAGLGRRYLPAELVVDAGVRGALRELLAVADRFYRSGDAGLAALPWRAAVAVRTARLVYADIGRVIAARGHDPHAGRAVVSTPRKLWLAARAAVTTARGRGPVLAPESLPALRFPDDVLPL